MEILKKPLITEKANSDSELKNRFTFLVKLDSNKVEIKKAVEIKYGVSVEKVWTQIYGSTRRTRYTKNGIQRGKSSSIKKAIVQLSDGDTIDFYNNI
tara:strand:+ start:1069 stop:1359 length:291 start_codon:yes stop_codon:yes gene_type:complete